MPDTTPRPELTVTVPSARHPHHRTTATPVVILGVAVVRIGSRCRDEAMPTPGADLRTIDLERR